MSRRDNDCCSNESYIPGTCQAERNRTAASAVLDSAGLDIAGVNTTQQMYAYCKLKNSCRRMALLKDFNAIEHSAVKECKHCDFLCLIMLL